MELKPQDGPQTEFLRRQEDEVLYGGAKGGGKSYALIIEALRQINIPGYRGIIFRRTFPRLQELIDRSKDIFPKLGATYSGQEHKWTFPSGAIIRFGHCQNAGDERNYNGHEYAFMGFDQLEEFLESQYLFICAQNRSTTPGVKCYVRSTANPGSVGHAWVKKRFIDNKEYSKTYSVSFNLPDGSTVSRTSAFIRATVYDNKILMKLQPQYLATLHSLPEREREALLNGNWDVFEGQYFSEFDRDKHVIKPFNVPSDWRRFCMGDYGFTAPSAVYWAAIAPNSDIYIYRELYQSGLTYTALAQEMRRRTPKSEIIGYSSFDPSIWNKHGSTGESGADQFFKAGWPVMKGDNNRVNGWGRVREFLSDPQGKPHLFISEDCVNLVRTLPSLVHDKHDVEDVDSACDDHGPDALRYGLMTRPKPFDVFVDKFKGMSPQERFFKQVEDEARLELTQSKSIFNLDGSQSSDPSFY